ncbi:hypothetical protein M422DRAFT_781812, partial [Sphaerobolus stellatus SS14]
MSQSAVEVIDLTSSPREVIEIEDGEEVEVEDTIADPDTPNGSVNGTPDPKDGRKPKRKKRRRRNRGKGLEEEGETKDENIVPGKGAEPEERGKKRKRGNELDVDNSNLKKRNRSPSPQQAMFTIDFEPTMTELASFVSSIPPPSLDFESKSKAPAQPTKNTHTEDGLLLPSHVSVATGDELPLPNEEANKRDLSPVSDASGIDFLDDDRAGGVPRYFQDAITPAKSHRACKRCGEEGHEVKYCPNQICLTCGAKNEHNTLSCPVLRVCFNCQGKGHLARNCPRIGGLSKNAHLVFGRPGTDMTMVAVTPSKETSDGKAAKMRRRELVKHKDALRSRKMMKVTGSAGIAEVP